MARVTRRWYSRWECSRSLRARATFPFHALSASSVSPTACLRDLPGPAFAPRGNASCAPPDGFLPIRISHRPLTSRPCRSAWRARSRTCLLDADTAHQVHKQAKHTGKAERRRSPRPAGTCRVRHATRSDLRASRPGGRQAGAALDRPRVDGRMAPLAAQSSADYRHEHEWQPSGWEIRKERLRMRGNKLTIVRTCGKCKRQYTLRDGGSKKLCERCLFRESSVPVRTVSGALPTLGKGASSQPVVLHRAAED